MSFKTFFSYRVVFLTMPIYHRHSSPSQTAIDATNQLQAGQLWGGRPSSYFKNEEPVIKAFYGSLPDGSEGIEFECDVPPDLSDHPYFVRWSGQNPDILVENGFAKIPVNITKVVYSNIDAA